MEHSVHKQRILVLVAICCGSLSVGLFFKFRQQGQAPMSDDQAKSLGYASAQDQAQTSEDFKKYWPDIVSKGRLTDWEFSLAAKTLKNGSQASKVRIIAALGYLQGESERKRALTLLPAEPMDIQTLAPWRSCFHRWMEGDKNGSVMQILTTSGNVNAAKIAEELRGSANA